MFGLGKLLYIVILTINGIAVLSEDRFLNRIGWGSSLNNGNTNAANQYQQFNTGFDNNDGTSVKTKIVNLIGAIRTLLRIPLIAVNIAVIAYEIVFG
ncbi:Yos1-like protein [Scheffersomyces coipomensis]|uniref:Yos1-like protein n=1 Tax=Scheffersomyces coipomensis TaxID=1788519 RepID=UPI00315D6C29